MNSIEDYKRAKPNLEKIITTIIDEPEQFIAYRDDRIPPTSINHQNATETTERILDFVNSSQDHTPRAYASYLMVHAITNEKTVRSKLAEYQLIILDYANWLQANGNGKKGEQNAKVKDSQ